MTDIYDIDPDFGNNITTKEAVQPSFDSVLEAAKNAARDLHRVSGAHITNIRVYTDYHGRVFVKAQQEFSDNA